LLAAARGGAALYLRAAGRAARVDNCAFLGHHRRRRVCRTLPRTGRSPGVLRPDRLPGWRLISLQGQWERFVADLPADEAPVLSRPHFDEWGERYLDTDSASRTRSPAAVKVPSGAFQDIYDAWASELAYDPARVCAPVAIVRGEWDGMCPDADARWLFDALSSSAMRRDVKIGRATHLMHLEQNRFALYREAETFLSGGDLEER
jgi:pimeloyl-ACP methyl ester carboxylesterase